MHFYLVGWDGGSYSNLTIVNENQKKLENMLNISISNHFYEKIPEETLILAGKMFIYLNSCPKNLMKSKIRKSFEEYVSKENVKTILLFLNRLIINSNENDTHGKNTALAILENIHHLQGLQFKKIEQISAMSSHTKMNLGDLPSFHKGTRL